MSFRLDGVASPVPPPGTGRRGGVGVQEDGGLLNEAARTTVVVSGLGGCLDPTETRPHGRSRATKDEKTARMRRPSTSSATGASTVERKPAC
jgi:hypothetical protein